MKTSKPIMDPNGTHRLNGSHGGGKPVAARPNIDAARGDRANRLSETDAAKKPIRSLTSRPERPLHRYSAKRLIRLVDFFCDAPQAASVCLIGDFNGWKVAADPMKRMPDGRWMIRMELHHGHHRYLILVDGIPRLDPNAQGGVRSEETDCTVPCENVSLIAVS